MNSKYFKFIKKNFYKIAYQYAFWTCYKIYRKISGLTYLPATISQKKFYKHGLLNQNAAASRISTYYYFSGELKLNIFKQSVNHSLNQHDIFHTTFALENGELKQISNDPITHDVEYYDLTENFSNRRLENLRENLASVTLNPEVLPLIKISVIKLPDSQYQFVFCAHHMVLDGWSLYNLQNQISKNYSLLLDGRPLSNEYKKAQFKDYVWVEKLAITYFETSRLKFWKNYLLKMEESLIPFLKGSKPVTYKADNIHKMINHRLMDKIDQYKSNHQVSTNTILLSAMFSLLYKYTNQNTLTVVIPRFTRFHPKQQEIVGPMLDGIPIIIELEGNETFTQLTDKVCQVLETVMQYDDIPFDYIIEQLSNNGDFDSSKLKNAISFNYISGEWRKPFHLQGLHYIRENFIPVTTTSLLSFYIVGQKESEKMLLDSQITYQNELIDPSMARAILDTYHDILIKLLSQPEERIIDVGLNPWGDHTCAGQEIRGLDEHGHELLSEILIKAFNEHPTHAALSVGGQKTTYEELKQSVLACCYLLEKNHPESTQSIVIIGARNEKWYAMLIAAVLKGVAFTLLDLNEREAVLVEKYQLLQTPVIFVSDETSYDIVIKKLSPVGCIKITLNEINGYQSTKCLQLDEVKADVKSDDKAYICFTSGSTGKPKKIIGTYDGLSHFVSWQIVRFKIDCHDRCAQVTNVNFDVVLREIFTPLCAGATLVVPSQSIYENGLPWLQQEEITMFHIVPSILQLMLNCTSTVRAGGFRSLRYIFFAGEPLYKSLVEELRRKFYDPGCLINLYGPSETTLAKLFYVFSEKNCDEILPIGKPIPGCNVFIINKGKQCGIGEQGEIVLETPYLTLLSENDRRLKYDKQTNKKHYFTGDLGYYNASGDICINGRKDSIVKVAGVKVDLGVIEQTLAQLKNIKEVCVTLNAKVNHNHKQMIVAHVVVESKDITPVKLILALKGALPKNHIPSHFHLIKELPRLTNGKIDRVSLKSMTNFPFLKDHEEINTDDYTPTEKKVSKILCKIAGVDVPNVDIKFSELGLTSLQDIQLLMLMQKEFSSHITLQDLKSHDSIRKLANLIVNPKQENDGVSLNAKSSKELEKYARFSIEKCIAPVKKVNTVKTIFLTGATGFLGNYILAELLESFPQATIICLVRCEDTHEGFERLRNITLKYNSSCLSQFDRVEILPGNLEKPNFGIKDNSYQNLVLSTDLIIHCGALVNFLFDFDALHDSNIEGTKNAISLAIKSQAPIHYVSTAGIFPGRKKWSNQQIHEDADIMFAENHPLVGGYAQTKWVSELLMQRAIKKEACGSIYRFGRISGALKNGIWPKSDFVFAYLASMVEIQSAPSLDVKIELTPVDVGAKMFVDLTKNNMYDNNIYHLINPNQLSFSELKDLFSQLQLALDVIPYHDWKNKLIDHIHKNKPCSLTRFVPLFPDHVDELPRLKYNRLFSNKTVYEKLSNHQLTFPILDAKLLKFYLEKNAVI